MGHDHETSMGAVLDKFGAAMLPIVKQHTARFVLVVQLPCGCLAHLCNGGSRDAALVLVNGWLEAYAADMETRRPRRCDA